jgi:hypothetical protein
MKKKIIRMTSGIRGAPRNIEVIFLQTVFIPSKVDVVSGTLVFKSVSP